MEENVVDLPRIIVDEHTITLTLLHTNAVLTRIVLSEDDSLQGIELYFDGDGRFVKLILLRSINNISIERPCIRHNLEMSMVYIFLRRTARHEHSVEVETLNEEIMFDFDSNDKIFGLAVFNVKKYFTPQFLQQLSEEVSIIVEGKEYIKSTNLLVRKPKSNTEEIKAPIEKKPRPLFLVSVCQGNLESVKQLYSENPEVLTDTDAKGGNIATLSAAFGHLDILKWAKDQGVSVTFRRNDGATPYLQAAFHGHAAVMKWLSENGCTDLNEADDMGDTALMHAAGGGHLEIVKWLTEAGADINRKSNSGSNALHRAATTGHLDVVKYLVFLKMQVDDKTTRGCTALHYAARNGHTELVKWLVEVAGASPFIKDNKNLCLVDIVGNPALEQWLNTWISTNGK